MKITGIGIIIIIFLAISAGCINSKEVKSIRSASDGFLQNFLKKHPQYFDTILKNNEKFGVQIIYTQIDREKKGKPRFTDHSFNLDADRYFYPASTVKFPVAVLALQKLNELAIAGLDRNTTMITDADGEGQTPVQNDPSATDGRPSIAHYIKKILLVSDNDAFNRLYEFLGQEYINKSLHRMGYKDAEIIHRLSISLSEEQNRRTNPVRFIDPAGNILYDQPVKKSELVYAQRNGNYLMGKGFIRGNNLVNEPFDFSLKNRLPLADLHQMVRSILFPDAVAKQQRFNLSRDDLDFLRRYMSMRPGESRSPFYDSAYWDNYVKMIYYGSEKTKPQSAIRIFNKTGTAYGFLTESCYFADFDQPLEFMVSAVIYNNSDGIFNDDKYDYTSLGYPFLKQLGLVLYQYEKTRKRKRTPDLSAFRYQYAE